MQLPGPMRLLTLLFTCRALWFADAVVNNFNANLYRVDQTPSSLQVWNGPQSLEQTIYTKNFFSISSGDFIFIPIIFTKVGNTIFAETVDNLINLPFIPVVGGSALTAAAFLPQRFRPATIYRFSLWVQIDQQPYDENGQYPVQLARGEILPDGSMKIYGDISGNPFPANFASRISGGFSFSYTTADQAGVFDSGLYLGPSLVSGVSMLTDSVTQSVEQWSGQLAGVIVAPSWNTATTLGLLSFTIVKIGQTVILSFMGPSVSVPFGTEIQISYPPSSFPTQFRPAMDHLFWIPVSTNNGPAHGARAHISSTGTIYIRSTIYKDYFAWNDNAMYPWSVTYTTGEFGSEPAPSPTVFQADLFSLLYAPEVSNPVPDLVATAGDTNLPGITQTVFSTAVTGSGQVLRLVFTSIGKQVTVSSTTDSLVGEPSVTVTAIPARYRPCDYFRFFYTATNIGGTPAVEARAEIRPDGIMQFYRDAYGNPFSTVPNNASPVAYAFSTTYVVC